MSEVQLREAFRLLADDLDQSHVDLTGNEFLDGYRKGLTHAAKSIRQSALYVRAEPAEEQPRPLAWREGNRIRHANGMGYGDQVTDEEIREHISVSERTIKHVPQSSAGYRDRERSREHIIFARAVLALREQERAEPQTAGEPS